MPGINAQGIFKPIYQSYDIAPGVSVPSRLGMHWGTLTGYSDQAKINMVADRMRAAGVSFSTVIVNSQHVE